MGPLADPPISGSQGPILGGLAGILKKNVLPTKGFSVAYRKVRAVPEEYYECPLFLANFQKFRNLTIFAILTFFLTPKRI